MSDIQDRLVALIRRIGIWKIGLSLAGAIVLVYFVMTFPPTGAGWDAYAYWNIDPANPYGRSFGRLDAFGGFLYSPPAALVMEPLGSLPWDVFVTAWEILLFGALVYVARSWTLAAFAFVGVPVSLYMGNVDLLIAASVVAGMRWPAAYAVAILLKPTSAIGLLWFVFRGAWRSLWPLAAVLAVVCGATLVLRPQLWSDWTAMLVGNVLDARRVNEILPAIVRYPVAIAVVALAARTNRLWPVGLAVALGQPVFTLRAATVGLSAIGLRRHERSSLGLESGTAGQAGRALDRLPAPVVLARAVQCVRAILAPR